MNNKFRNNPELKPLLQKIKNVIATLDGKALPLKFMEVCGTHTVSILKFGFRHYFKDSIKFLSGPGCPVCVTSAHDVDKIIYLAQQGNHLVTFGDLIKVPGTHSSLEREIAKGATVDVVYSPLDTIKIASNTKKEVIFIAIGFETTIPVIAGLVLDAYAQQINNVSILCLVKTMPNVLRFLLSQLKGEIDGMIMPGHVSVIIGSEPYEFVPQEYGIPCAIAGFEPVDLGLGIQTLVAQISSRDPKVDNRYTRMVRSEGNRAAQELISAVFQECDVSWRGFGSIPRSGLCLNEEFSFFDAEKRFRIKVKDEVVQSACICGDIIAGRKSPLDCTLFRKNCTPENPIGPCMVSFEGACAAYYKYGE
ncbi:MAG: hydrogenase formation protein HypD [Candidatus Cloacimonas sp. 4484_140]|nr:MAG: hydrogenase formation protein HypD [Candidatus Cloacimonas sp. 4484_140]